MRTRLARRDQARVWLVGAFHPSERRLAAAPKLLMPARQAADAQRILDVDVPDFVEQARHLRPVTFIKQQVVALGDDQRRFRENRDRPGNRLLDFAPEFGCLDDFVGCLMAQTTQQIDIAGAIEGIRRPLSARSTKACQLDVGQVVAIHRHDL